MTDFARIPLIAVVDDHQDIRDLVKRFLEQHGVKAITARDGKELDALLQSTKPDLIVLDIMLPGEDGVSICKRLRSAGNRIPVIMLTAMSEDTDRIVGLEIGADDYMTKPFNPRELLARIKAVLRRAAGSSGEETVSKNLKYYKFINLRLDVQKRELTEANGTLIALSTAEYDLLLTFLTHPSETLSRDQLLDLARGRTAQVFDRSIDTLVSRLRKKLRESTDSQDIIKTVWGGGYCFTAEIEHEFS